MTRFSFGSAARVYPQEHRPARAAGQQHAAPGPPAAPAGPHAALTHRPGVFRCRKKNTRDAVGSAFTGKTWRSSHSPLTSTHTDQHRKTSSSTGVLYNPSSLDLEDGRTGGWFLLHQPQSPKGQLESAQGWLSLWSRGTWGLYLTT